MTQRVPPKVYTIGPERPFLATLADGLLAMTAGDPMRLPRVSRSGSPPVIARSSSASVARNGRSGAIV